MTRRWEPETVDARCRVRLLRAKRGRKRKRDRETRLYPMRMTKVIHQRHRDFTNPTLDTTTLDLRDLVRDDTPTLLPRFALITADVQIRRFIAVLHDYALLPATSSRSDRERERDREIRTSLTSYRSNSDSATNLLFSQISWFLTFQSTFYGLPRYHNSTTPFSTLWAIGNMVCRVHFQCCWRPIS